MCKPRWTEKEKERARAIRLLFPLAQKLDNDQDCPDLIGIKDDFGKYANIFSFLFPSLKPGEKVNINEIIGGGANMAKPLKDWTLEELQRWCWQYQDSRSHTARSCQQSCPIYKRDICAIACVHEWDLKERPPWTEQEVKMAKAIKEIWPDAEDVRARTGENGNVEYRVCNRCIILGVIYDDVFPTMQCNKEYDLDEIIGADDANN